MAAKKDPSPAFSFASNFLQRRPGATFQDARAAAEKRGIILIPIVWGRAMKSLGMVSPSATKKAATKKAASTKAGTRKAMTRGAPPMVRRRPGRPAKATTGALVDLQSVIQSMKDLESDRERFRRALEQIQEVIARAL